jgi:hypothetical protein
MSLGDVRQIVVAGEAEARGGHPAGGHAAGEVQVCRHQDRLPRVQGEFCSSLLHSLPYKGGS